jgi:hypothetical protein
LGLDEFFSGGNEASVGFDAFGLRRGDLALESLDL